MARFSSVMAALNNPAEMGKQGTATSVTYAVLFHAPSKASQRLSDFP
eukprot:CAMPEP_0171082294 /NCGR_PEP_ID=MMETSP0766_2-20121228/17016_1 /TAXON_ID=439317 /ORGANISM="Gambierdiscus australes, Strain CAWD 149" /LENGTH=46 /DNA_ID= /DNA_START= /DNA_END= /DNA_ORIENTATION=